MHGFDSKEIQPQTSSFLEYFKVLQKRKWLVLFWVIGGVIPFVLINRYSIPIYEAEATVIYEEPKDTMFALNVGQSSHNRTSLINMIELLVSRSFAKNVAGSLTEEVNKAFKKINVLPIRGSDILRIKAQASDSAAAQTIANAYVDHAIQWNLQKKREEISSVREFVEKQLTIFKEKLNSTEETLRIFKEKNKMVTLNEASSELLRKMTQAEVAYDHIKAERAALEQRRRAIEQKKQELAPTLIVATSPLAQQLQQSLLALEARLTDYQVKNGLENQSDTIALKKKIAEVKQQLIQELMTTTHRENLIDPLSQIRSLLQETITLEVSLETVKAREKELKQILTNHEAEFQTLPRREMELARLIQARDVDDKIYCMLLTRLEESRITEAGKVGDVRVIDPAEKPGVLIKPNKKKNVVMGLMLGLGLGIGLAFFLESLDTTLKSQEDLEKYLTLPVLAAIPSINPNGAFLFKKNYHHTAASYTRKLISNLQWNSPVYEAFRALRLNFAFVHPDHTLKSVLITSASPGEGKTLIAINVAQIFARSGIKTMLVDCDLRRPMVHKIFSISGEPGLTEVLINKAALSQVVYKMENMNLWILPCGTQPPNPSELLDSARMQELLGEVRNEYDLIIVDSPPLMAVTDALVLSTEVDGVCLVIKSGKTSHEMARRAKQLLENSRTRIIGTILNDVDLKSVYGYKDYYDYYSNNGGHESIKKQSVPRFNAESSVGT